MNLTILNRLKLCYEILTVKSGHKHTAQEKQLSTFMRGYQAGYEDCKFDNRIELQEVGSYVNPETGAVEMTYTIKVKP